MLTEIGRAKVIAGWWELSKKIEDLMKQQPPGDDLLACDVFLRELHGLYFYTATECGKAETLFNMCFYDFAKSDQIPKDILRSSTMVNQYVAGHFSKEFSIWKQMGNNLKAIEITTNDYRTLLASFRREERMGGISTQT